MTALNVISFGECMLEVQANGFGPAAFAYGGDTLNTAVYLRRCSRPQDIQVGYATGLGSDPLSLQLRKAWTRQGLGLNYTREVEGKLPGMYLIETDEHGERRFHFWRENSAARDYFDAAITPLEQTQSSIDCLYFSGISLAILDAPSRDRFFTLLSQMRDAGKQVVFDNNYRPRLWADVQTTRKVFDRAFSVASMALITADDHHAVYGFDSLALSVAHAQALTPPEKVIKQGALPTLVNQEGQSDWNEVPAQNVSKVVDTTAAGDSFAAAYLSRRLLGMPGEQAAAFGNLLAARVIQHRGAVIPEEVMRDLM
jgi:2-dehydro-3-deoxygluconokinase